VRSIVAGEIETAAGEIDGDGGGSNAAFESLDRGVRVRIHEGWSIRFSGKTSRRKVEGGDCVGNRGERAD
jgi:hypothetical protein